MTERDDFNELVERFGDRERIPYATLTLTEGRVQIATNLAKAVDIRLLLCWAMEVVAEDSEEWNQSWRDS